MNDQEIEQSVRDIFVAILQISPEKVVLKLSPDDCEQWDSLHHIHLVNAINETLGVDLTVEQQVEMLTFDLAVEVVKEAMRGAGQGPATHSFLIRMMPKCGMPSTASTIFAIRTVFRSSWRGPIFCVAWPMCRETLSMPERSRV
ncbi:MAG: acyl carrier protein [Pseudomonadota bacterium]|nr:acyl carrier protein [Pseudomonadota bacterium]